MHANVCSCAQQTADPGAAQALCCLPASAAKEYALEFVLT